MFLRTLLLAVALGAMTVPAMASVRQAAPAPAAPAMSAEEAAFTARVAAFSRGISAMETEMRAAVVAAGGDAARRDAALAAIVARQQPEADAVGAEIEAFMTARANLAPEERRPQMLEGARILSQQAVLAPSMMRDAVVRSAAAPVAAQ